MPERMDLTDNIDLRAQVTSGERRGRLDLGIQQAPEQHEQQQLPAEYGRLLFQLLVVDTEFLFVSWEIPPAELEFMRTTMLPTDFHTRRLLVRLRDEGLGGAIGTTQELYGELGRWFMHHGMAGRRITADIGYACGDRFYALTKTGPVSLPRDFCIEPARFTELSISYRIGAGGELILENTQPHVHDTWPEAGLREAFQPPAARITDPARVTEGARHREPSVAHWSGLPSSPFGNTPSSPAHIPDAGSEATGGKDND